MQDVSEDMHAKKENVGASGRFSCLSEIKKRKSIRFMLDSLWDFGLPKGGRL